VNPSFSFRAGGDSRLAVSWKDGEHAFCRRWHYGARRAVLAVLPAAPHRRLTAAIVSPTEYGMKDDLGGAWVVGPPEFAPERLGPASAAACVKPYPAWILSIISEYSRDWDIHWFLSATICNRPANSPGSANGREKSDQYLVRTNVLHGGAM